MKTFLFSFFLLGSCASFAQTTFTVLNSYGAPEGRVSVYYHHKLIAYTDKEGKVRIPGRIPAGDSVKFVLGEDFTWFVGDNGTSVPVEYTVRLHATGQTEQVVEDRWGGVPTPVEPDMPEAVKIDVPAEFPGGRKALDKYISEKLIYPEAAKKKRIQGSCDLRFKVSDSGAVYDIELIKGVEKCYECDLQAIRLMKTMPRWTPAKADGKSVWSEMTLSVDFKLKK